MHKFLGYSIFEQLKIQGLQAGLAHQRQAGPGLQQRFGLCPQVWPGIKYWVASGGQCGAPGQGLTSAGAHFPPRPDPASPTAASVAGPSEKPVERAPVRPPFLSLFLPPAPRERSPSNLTPEHQEGPKCGHDGQSPSSRGLSGMIKLTRG